MIWLTKASLWFVNLLVFDKITVANGEHSYVVRLDIYSGVDLSGSIEPEPRRLIGYLVHYRG